MTIRQHGASKYANGECRCDVCRKAANARMNKRKRKVRRLRVPGPDGRPVTTADVEHGRYTTYTNWACRCGPCSEAHSASQAVWRERRRAATP